MRQVIVEAGQGEAAVGRSLVAAVEVCLEWAWEGEGGRVACSV